METVVELRPMICHLHEHERALPDKHTLLSNCRYLRQLYNAGRQHPLHQQTASLCALHTSEYPCSRGDNNTPVWKLLRKHSKQKAETKIPQVTYLTARRFRNNSLNHYSSVLYYKLISLGIKYGGPFLCMIPVHADQLNVKFAKQLFVS